MSQFIDVTIVWEDPNVIERGHKVYRSKAPMDVNNMPEAIAELDKNATRFVDKDQPVGDTNYYRVSAWINGLELFSEEVAIEVKGCGDGHGPSTWIGGDCEHGFMGEVSTNDFITGDELASRLGITQGTSYNSNTVWLKFTLEGDTIIIPKKPIRHSISWDHIYSRGAVYGTGDNGLYPTGTPSTQDATVEIDGYTYQVRLLKGANADQASLTGSGSGYDVDWTHGSEWNRLMYPIHSGVHTESSNPSNPSEPYNQWASYSDVDLLVHQNFGNGSNSWCREQVATSTDARVGRGGYGVSRSTWSTSSNAHSNRGWRPALVLVK